MSKHALHNLMTSRDYDKIIRLDALISKKPQEARLWLLKGRIYHSKMADDLAVVAFKKAVELNPCYVNAYFWLAECLKYHLGEYDEAEKVALEGLQIDPQHKDLLQLLTEIREDQELIL